MKLILSIAIIYLIVLITIKKSQVLTLKREQGKPICPKCQNTLKRIERKRKDKSLKYLTLFLFEWKRYI